MCQFDKLTVLLYFPSLTKYVVLQKLKYFCLFILVHTYIYIYIYICVCVSVWAGIVQPVVKSLRGRRSGDRNPVGARFSAPVQNGPGAYPASYKLGTGSFPGVNRPLHDVDHPPPSSAEVKESVDLIMYSPYGLSWPFLV